MKFNSMNSSFKPFCNRVPVMSSSPQHEWMNHLWQEWINVLDVACIINSDILKTEHLEGGLLTDKGNNVGVWRLLFEAMFWILKSSFGKNNEMWASDAKVIL
jgi:hypothetical protein